MCGIAGIISANPASVYRERLKKMTDAIAHRGPDGQALWINAGNHAGFGHRRLAIIDLSAQGAQPMHYRERYTIVHNGEIYNYIELKQALQNKGYRFYSGSDTEVIAAAYDHYKGQAPFFLDGMFAFAIWDEQEQVLFAARDRFGEKPFFYSFREQELVFASEIKALWAAGIKKNIDNEVLAGFLALGSTRKASAPEKSLYTGITDLPPASSLKFVPQTGELTIKKYWKLEKTFKESFSDADAIVQLRELFEKSIRRRLRSDVAVGASLSGGIDSSSIVAAMHNQKKDHEAVRTFSCIFPGFSKDESPYIKLITDKFGAEAYHVSPRVDDFIKDLKKVLTHQEELISSASIYVQYKVYELAKQKNVKVLLDGQGADEILAGYSRYLHWFLQETLVSQPMSLGKELRAFRLNGAEFEWGWKNYLAAYLPSLTRSRLESREIKKIRSGALLNRELLHDTVLRSFKPRVKNLNDILHYNTVSYGLEELLRYGDRNSMAHGRETRLPFLQHELVEFLFSLPSRFKIRDGWTKWLLRMAMSGILPEPIVWRKDKVGFEPPQKQWMQHKKVQSLVHEAKKKLVAQHILDASVLNKKIQPLDTHAADNFDWRYLVAGSIL
jgi:asparagine synthase (glutamine-hydrolysing)